jgi:hypothetical protein
MEIYTTKVKRLTGSSYTEVYPKAKNIFRIIESRTKRRPYIRSAYFGGEKIFLDYFWNHLQGKNWRDRFRRLQQYPCALDLLKNNRLEPVSKENSAKSSETFHRFKGINGNGQVFFVQVKESRKNGEKDFMSSFPGD